MKNMCEGSSSKCILLFAIPVLLGNVFQQCYNLVDTMMVAKLLGMQSLAAMGASASLCMLFIGFASGIALGGSIQLSHSFGAKDEQGMKHAIAGCIKLSITLGCILIVLGMVLRKQLLVWLQTPESILYMSDRYLLIIILGLVVTIAYNVMACLLRAIGDSKTPLYFLIVASICNIVFDYVLMAIFHFGVEGAAIATVCAQMISVVLCYLYMMNKYELFHLKKEDFKVNKQMYYHQMNMAISMGLMNSIVAIGSVILQYGVNGLGEVVIAGHSAARKVVEMFMQPLASVAVADTTFVAQNIGAKQFTRIKEGLLHSIWMNMIWVIIVILISYTCVESIFAFLVREQEVIDIASYYCRITTPFYFVLSVLFIYRNALQGLGKGNIVIVSSCIEMVVKMAMTFLLVPYTNYLGVALAEPIAWILMAIFLVYFFYQSLNKVEIYA